MPEVSLIMNIPFYLMRDELICYSLTPPSIPILILQCAILLMKNEALLVLGALLLLHASYSLWEGRAKLKIVRMEARGA